jgi:hypothetical protein
VSLILDVIQGLNSEGVSYVVVGGVAVVLHGRNRVTMDLDLVISLDDANIRKTVKILTGLGLKPRIPVNPLDFADSEIRRQWVEERGMDVFSFIDPTRATAGVDIFATYQVDYSELVSRSVLGPLGETQVRCCSLDDLTTIESVANRGSAKRKRDPGETEPWPVDWESHRRDKIVHTALHTTPAQRFAWLEEMLELLRPRMAELLKSRENDPVRQYKK